MSLRLIAPRSYWEAPPELRSKVCNGCGPAAWRVDPIPDTIWGLDISPACNIHDWMYHEGVSKAEADQVFLVNMVILCLQGSKWLLWLRLPRCLTYYLAVANFGEDSFEAAA